MIKKLLFKINDCFGKINFLFNKLNVFLQKYLILMIHPIIFLNRLNLILLWLIRRYDGSTPEGREPEGQHPC